jgi:hypothetical protein
MPASALGVIVRPVLSWIATTICASTSQPNWSVVRRVTPTRWPCVAGLPVGHHRGGLHPDAKSVLPAIGPANETALEIGDHVGHVRAWRLGDMRENSPQIARRRGRRRLDRGRGEVSRIGAIDADRGQSGAGRGHGAGGSRSRSARRPGRFDRGSLENLSGDEDAERADDGDQCDVEATRCMDVRR